MPGPDRVGRWVVERLRAPAGVLHSRPWSAVPTVSVLESTGPALVLGSTQRDEVVNAAEAGRRGVEVVRRRSGGGAVLVEPGALLWVDVFVPAGDGLWDDDVTRAFHWLGRAWADTIGDLGVNVEAHLGAARVDRWSGLVCFAGLGPGEVRLGDGRKVVGLCQRRTRAGALFQCGALLEWRPDALLALLDLDDEARADGAGVLDEVAAGLGLGGTAMKEAFLGRLSAC